MNRTTVVMACAMLASFPLTLGSALAQAVPPTADSAAANADAYVQTVESTFDDVSFAVEQAITNEGLVIDLTSHVGDMLARTKEDVGGEKDLFTHANVYSFCSAKVSRQVMEADPANVQFCPYGIFVYERVDQPGKIIVGHRVYPGETMKPVNDLLTKIVDTGSE